VTNTDSAPATGRVVRYASPEHTTAPRRTDQDFQPLSGSVLRGAAAAAASSVLPTHPGHGGPRNFVVSAEIERARAEARAEADAEAQQREAAHRAELQHAYDTGLADGKELAERDGLTILRTLSEAITGAKNQAAHGAAQQLRADIGDLLDVAAAVATWAIERELSADTSLLLGRLTTAIDGLVFPEQAAVSANPDDIATLRRWREERSAAGLPATFELDADSSVPPGQARVRCGGQVADLTAPAAVRRALAVISTEVGGA
jgi:flagellar biosynthesis/type III secretory pathway protein FliH